MTRRDVAALVKARAGIALDIGCGANKHPGAVGLDIRPLPTVDIVHDFETTPWPLPDSCVHTVYLSHVWEHINPKVTLAFMTELHRVCQGHAQIFIAAPYGMGFRYQQDPTHCNPSNEATWYYFDVDHPLYQVYCPPPFKLRHYERIPVGHDSDFNCVLEVVKPDVAPTKTAKRRRAA